MRLAPVWCLVVACGGGGISPTSSIDPDRRMTEMTPAEIEAFCEYQLELFGPRRTIDCGGGTTAMRGLSTTLEQCVMETTEDQLQFPECQITVGELETCFEALAGKTDAAICMGDDDIPIECAPLFGPGCGSLD